MSEQPKSEPELRAALKSRLESTRDSLEGNPDIPSRVKEEVMRIIGLGLQKLEAIPVDATCPPELKATIAEQLDEMLSAMKKLITVRKARIMNKEQLLAQLTSAKEQAETSMPSIVPSIDVLLEDIDKFDTMSEGKRSSYIAAAEQWIKFVQLGDPNFEAKIKDFRNTVEVGDGTRSAKDTTFMAYSTMYAVDFASTFCSVFGGLSALDENSPPEETMEVLGNIMSMMRGKRDAAQCYLQSIGIGGPQEALIQLEWLQQIVIEKAKDADMKFEMAEVRGDGRVRIQTSEDDGICWERKDGKKDGKKESGEEENRREDE